MTPDQDFAELCEEFPGWHIWRGRDGHGQPNGWHATRQTRARSTIVAADGPEQLRQRVRQAEAKAAVAS
jgi:hypothetical protein